VPGLIRPTACGARAKPTHMRGHCGLLCSPAASSARPARAWHSTRAARGHRATPGWHGRQRLAGRLGVGEQAGIAHTRRGGCAGQGGTGGDASRRPCDDRAERSARDDGAPVEGGSVDHRRVRQGPAAREEQGCEEMAVDG
jgi:hypothetical protein